MILEILHRTRMRYPVPVLRSTNVARLVPADAGPQRRLAFALAVEPAAPVRAYEDAWGNTVHYFALARPHFELVIIATSRVETASSAPADGFAAWEEYRPGRLGPLLDLALPTPLTDVGGVSVSAPGADAWAWVREQVAGVPGRLRYRKGTTGVTTAAADALARGEGVCQDFAHVALGLLRARGIPARYAAGYQYLGAGAAAHHEPHAWVEVWHPAAGWLGFDPTTGGAVDDRYVRAASGRDYNDAAPVRGHVIFATPTAPEAVPEPEVTVEIAVGSGATPPSPSADAALPHPPQSVLRP